MKKTIIIFVILYLLDQLSKYLVEIFIPEGEVVVVIDNFLSLTKTYNTGAAWSMFNDNTIILVLISLVGTIALAFFCTKNDWKREKFASVTLTMALAGCVGNFFDRLISVIPNLNEHREGVVDMIIFKPFDWLCEAFNLGTTVFNVADAFLVVGLLLFAVDLIFFSEKRKKKYGTN